MKKICWLLVAVLAWACSSDPYATTAGAATGADRACVPGAQISCACVGAQVGAQSCKADGSGYAPCVCPDGSTSGAGGAGGGTSGMSSASETVAAAGGVGSVDAGADAADVGSDASQSPTNCGRSGKNDDDACSSKHPDYWHGYYCAGSPDVPGCVEYGPQTVLWCCSDGCVPSPNPCTGKCEQVDDGCGAPVDCPGDCAQQFPGILSACGFDGACHPCDPYPGGVCPAMYKNGYSCSANVNGAPAPCKVVGAVGSATIVCCM